MRKKTLIADQKILQFITKAAKDRTNSNRSTKGQKRNSSQNKKKEFEVESKGRRGKIEKKHWAEWNMKAAQSRAELHYG